jgi:outer membrane protein OmpA-like peptidoglycan-associated protein
MPGSVLPNGVAVGALVSFDGDTITMSGALPTEQAVLRLVSFVTEANMSGKPIVNNVTVAPVAGGDSVRFVGLDPHAFPEGTGQISPAHAADLDRIAELLNEFPDVTVVVVGRTDRRGPAAQRLDVATDRAEALVAYLTSAGVEAGRLTSVAFAATESGPADDNVVSMALDRRAEFVVYGFAP